MSNLPGNPWVDYRESIGNAILAVAFEQRTANLIAIATAVSADGVHLLDPDIVQSAQWELYERLGIEASK